ncbi:MAG: metallophosphoesterase [Rhodospirillales bacterium]|nr:metallophosphoesterase [Rhodospirillales bacterium]
MKLLFLGDIVGRSGRDAVIAQVPDLRARLDLDFVIVNGENAAHGFGLSPTIAADLHAAGVDCITTGNHVWDKKELIPHLEQDARVLRPMNYPEGTPGRGYSVYEARGGRRVLVINLMARLFMDPLDDPFASIERVLKTYRLGRDPAAIVLDFHGEASSEKMAMGHWLDGRATLVVGTHTHTPTADTMILPGGTAYQTDAGMCGDYDSVIGMGKVAAVTKFIRKMPGERLAPADGEATICGVFVETDDATGLARRAEPLRLGGRLIATVPSATATA